MQAIAEAFAFGLKAGLDRQKLLAVLVLATVIAPALAEPRLRARL
jgi:3-hydroxyisobutyrate dehydrogenase-like beta-hydroxyacid dehydrogenase